MGKADWLLNEKQVAQFFLRYGLRCVNACDHPHGFSDFASAATVKRPTADLRESSEGS
jgi:hypothetical protein